MELDFTRAEVLGKRQLQYMLCPEIDGQSDDCNRSNSALQLCEGIWNKIMRSPKKQKEIRQQIDKIIAGVSSEEEIDDEDDAMINACPDKDVASSISTLSDPKGINQQSVKITTGASTEKKTDRKDGALVDVQDEHFVASSCFSQGDHTLNTLEYCYQIDRLSRCSIEAVSSSIETSFEEELNDQIEDRYQEYFFITPVHQTYHPYPEVLIDAAKADDYRCEVLEVIQADMDSGKTFADDVYQSECLPESFHQIPSLPSIDQELNDHIEDRYWVYWSEIAVKEATQPDPAAVCNQLPKNDKNALSGEFDVTKVEEYAQELKREMLADPTLTERLADDVCSIGLYYPCLAEALSVLCNRLATVKNHNYVDFSSLVLRNTKLQYLKRKELFASSYSNQPERICLFGFCRFMVQLYKNLFTSRRVQLLAHPIMICMREILDHKASSVHYACYKEMVRVMGKEVSPVDQTWKCKQPKGKLAVWKENSNRIAV